MTPIELNDHIPQLPRAEQIVLLSMLADTVADQAQAWTNTSTDCGQLVDTIPQGTSTDELLGLMAAIITRLKAS